MKGAVQKMMKLKRQMLNLAGEGAHRLRQPQCRVSAAITIDRVIFEIDETAPLYWSLPVLPG